MTDAGIPFDNHRSNPVTAVSPWVDALRAANIDFFWTWDELTGWFPASLWDPANTAVATVRDPHSTHDPFLLAAAAAAHDPTISLRLTTDVLRTHPADTMRKML